MPGTTAYVSHLPYCSLDKDHGLAYADAKLDIGPWAYVCPTCFAERGCSLGTGRGQALVVRDGTL